MTRPVGNSFVPFSSRRPATEVISTHKTSMITLKQAILYYFKTGQRDWPKT